MDIDKILEDFAIPERFPREAIAAATANREEVLPRFLKELEDFAAGVDEPEVPTPVFCIFHLLGSWGETRAYRTMARALMADEERVDWAFGDAVTETVHRVMLSVYDGDPQPLYDIIESDRAHPWMRGKMMELLALLARRGQLPREQVIAYLRDAPDRLEPRDTHDMWIGWQSAIVTLGAAELTDRVHQAFLNEWIHPSFMDFQDFDDDLRRIQADPNDRHVIRGMKDTPFGDFEKELGSWNWDWGGTAPDTPVDPLVDPAKLASLLSPLLKREAAVSNREPAANPYRGVGRNDPCPCGSGKKFKKCHGA